MESPKTRRILAYTAGIGWSLLVWWVLCDRESWVFGLFVGLFAFLTYAAAVYLCGNYIGTTDLPAALLAAAFIYICGSFVAGVVSFGADGLLADRRSFGIAVQNAVTMGVFCVGYPMIRFPFVAIPMLMSQTLLVRWAFFVRASVR
jgi:hypothetical protein